MKRLAMLVGLFAIACAPALAMQHTVTGIPLDAPWKVTIYHLARTHFIHPAWGWQHSERNYDLALELAKGDGLKIDPDVLFAAAFLHDMAAFTPYQGKGEHGEVAAQKSGPILRAAGFPMQKFPAVQAAMRGHMYYSNPGTQPEAVVLHDADSLDFLGAIGAARMLALAGPKSPSFEPELHTLQTFVRVIPPRLITKTAQRIGAIRAAQLARFIREVQSESFNLP